MEENTNAQAGAQVAQSATASTQGDSSPNQASAAPQTAQQTTAQARQTAQPTGNAQEQKQDLGIKDDLMDAYGADGGGDAAQEEPKQEEPKEEAKPEEKPDPLDAVPETYAFLDDSGANIQMPDEDRAAFNAAFKDANLTQRQANSLYKSYQVAGKKMAEQLNAQYQEAFINRSKEWISAIKSDPEIGGDHYKDTKSNIGRVMARFGTPALRQFLNESQDGYNPEMVRFFNNVGKALSEDSFVNGNGGAPTHEDQIKMDRGLYPNSPDTWGK